MQPVRRFVEQLGDAKVEQLRVARLLVQHHVRRLDVAVNELLCVRRDEAGRNVEEDLQRFGLLRARSLQTLLQRLAINKLVSDEGRGWRL
jgi:hypothetical protein